MLLRKMWWICLPNFNVELLLLVLVISEVDAEIWRANGLQAIPSFNCSAVLIIIIHCVDHSILSNTLLVWIVIGLRVHIPTIGIVLVVVDGRTSILWWIHLAGVKHVQFVHVIRVELRTTD